MLKKNDKIIKKSKNKLTTFVSVPRLTFAYNRIKKKTTRV